MLNRKRVQLMTKLARYEKGEGGKNIRISRYYRSDYIGIALLKNFFAVTAAYFILAGVVLVSRIDTLMEDFNERKLQIFVMEAVACYLIMLAVYSGITYTVASVRYARAKKSIAAYEGALGRLEKIYERETEKETDRAAGGNQE